jgi:hypothetical protein
MRQLIRRLADRGKSDIILVDARAGLSEITAPAVVGLGGDILLFGVKTPQTVECYSYLLAHLARFVVSSEEGSDWRFRLRMVHAKAGLGETAWRHYRERAYELFANFLYEEMDDEGAGLTAFNFDIDDPEAPHFPWPIPFDNEFSEFNPVDQREALQRDFCNRTFSNFTENVYFSLFPNERLGDD